MMIDVHEDTFNQATLRTAQKERLQLTLRDLAILDALAQRVKVLSLSQAARWFWGGDDHRAVAARRLGQLVRAGLLEVTQLLVGREIDLLAPLAVWRPGEPQPAWSPLLRTTRARWVGPVAAARCFLATPHTAARFGCSTHAPRISDALHDLHLSQIFLRLWARNPSLAGHWRGEAREHHWHEGDRVKVPDAVICGAGRPVAIEVVGSSYGMGKLSAFHAFCESQDMAYQLW